MREEEKKRERERERERAREMRKKLIVVHWEHHDSRKALMWKHQTSISPTYGYSM
jgi:hypothetical protein